MCHVVSDAINLNPAPQRRQLLKMLGAGAVGAVAAGAGVAGTAAAATPAGRSRGKPTSRTRLVLLGTAGGPSYAASERFGISSAVVYGDRVYLVDLGLGSFQRLASAGLGTDPELNTTLTNVRGIFFTHLHTDHVTDWPALYATGTTNTSGRTGDPIRVYGPGDRDTPTELFPPGRPEPRVVNPARPYPGISAMTDSLRSAFAQDFNDRLRASGLTDPASLFDVRDIDLGGSWTIDPAGVPPRLPEPIRVWTDGDVKITATLVDHRPTAPAFGFRFDTPDGSIVFSGDTCPSENLIDLARGADYLVHEVIDPAFVVRLTAALPPAQAEAVREHLLVSHTTIEQVGRDVAQVAGVKNLVLSHLVPGTNPDSTWRRAQRGYRGNLIIGKDLMQIPVGRR